MLVKLVLGSELRLYDSRLRMSDLKQFIEKEFKLKVAYKLVHVDSNCITELENDADLMGLKYMTKSQIIRLRIVPSKSSKEIEDEIVKEEVNDTLNALYDEVIQKNQEEQTQQEVQNYLNKLYKKVETSSVLAIESKVITEQVDEYMRSLSKNTTTVFKKYDQGITLCRLRPREDTHNKKKVRFSIEKDVDLEESYKEKRIEQIVSEKIVNLIPNLVDTIYKKLKKEIQTPKCSNCDHNESRDFEDYINKEIRKKCRTSIHRIRDDIEVGCQSAINPQDD